MGTRSHRVHWGYWWRQTPQVNVCATCGCRAACWWISFLSRQGNPGPGVEWRCIHHLPHLTDAHGNHWHDPRNTQSAPFTRECLQVLVSLVNLA